MELTDFTLKLILLLIPGTICSLIIETVALHKKFSQFRLIINTILLSILTLAFLQFLYWGFQLFHVCRPNFQFTSLDTWELFFDKNQSINPLELFLCIPIAIVTGFLVGSAIQFKLVNKLAQKLHLSNKFGDDSLFMHFLSNQVWVYVRDKKKGLTYYGIVNAYAEDEQSKEIVLRRVIVYEYATSTELYQLSHIYLKFNEDDLTIETPLQINN
jgi:hypothetical protein